MAGVSNSDFIENGQYAGEVFMTQELEAENNLNRGW